MFTLGKIKLFSAEDLVEAFHISKETAYKLMSLPQATIVELGRKKLITEDNLFNLLNKKVNI